MKYLQRSFSTGANSNKYRDNWERIFSKKKDKETEVGTTNDVKQKQ